MEKTGQEDFVYKIIIRTWTLCEVHAT